MRVVHHGKSWQKPWENGVFYHGKLRFFTMENGNFTMKNDDFTVKHGVLP
jgi:hypothetical protein